MNRHESRIMATLALYHYDISQQISENSIKSLDIAYYFLEDGEEIDRTFSNELFQGTIDNLTEIDNVIIKSLYNWTLDRLSYLDRAIIRLATYEMLYTSTPHAIIIDEALEITKEYSNLNDNNQVKFSNKLLDKLSEVIKGE